MHKELKYLLLLLILLASCEEYYTPNIDLIDGQLVVEAMITNDLSRNFVHLTKTSDFYNKQQTGDVIGASVELIENSSKVVMGTESGTGYFRFSTVPVIGKNYKLRIKYQNETYESEIVTMPPLPTILDAYSGNKVKRIYRTDAYGIPLPLDMKGRDIYIDAPVTNELSHYRFFTRSILQWLYAPAGKGGPPPPPLFGWQSFYDNSIFNIAGPKTFSQSDKIEKHPILWLSYDSRDYLLTDTLVSYGWILIVDQYGISKGSYEFHEKLNSQFTADGSLFDPIQTQVYGNITCITDPSKIVFGYFDLNSYRQYRYYTNLYVQEKDIKLRQILSYPYIPEKGQIYGFPPDWWER
ncbi:MAG: DUF4249 domain-containing protein [Bacteroidia bacterium]|nr:DUF4249 domain-containing protein [Bacteroidia bacterium]